MLESLREKIRLKYVYSVGVEWITCRYLLTMDYCISTHTENVYIDIRVEIAGSVQLIVSSFLVPCTREQLTRRI